MSSIHSPKPEVNVQFRNLDRSDPIAADLDNPIPDREGPRWRRTRAAVVDGKIVALGTLALAWVTDSYLCEVNVSSSYRRRGIGTALFADLQGIAHQPLPIHGRAMRSQPLRRSFAEHLGGTVLMQCPMPRVDPTSEESRDWAESQELPAGFTLAQMTAVPVEEVCSAWTAYFIWAHRPFGVVRPEALATAWDGHRSGIDPVMSYVCRARDGGVVAFSLVSPDVWDGRTFIIAETCQREQDHGVELLQAVVAASLHCLAERGIQHVEIEGHSTDAHIPQLFQTLPSSSSDPMDMYVMVPV